MAASSWLRLSHEIYRIVSSARVSMDSGIVTPIALTVFRLPANTNLLGRSNVRYRASWTPSSNFRYWPRAVFPPSGPYQRKAYGRFPVRRESVLIRLQQCLRITDTTDTPTLPSP